MWDTCLKRSIWNMELGVELNSEYFEIRYNILEMKKENLEAPNLFVYINDCPNI